MLRLALACLLLITGAARADECDGLARQIAESIGGKVGRRSGPSIDIRMPGAIKVDVTCRAEPIVQASSAEAQPSPAFFNDLAVASQILVGEPAATVARIIARAHAASLAERRKSFIQQNGWSASCYTDPGGSSFRTLCSVGRIPPG
ncbi:hypothetical protein [Methylobacterium radiodurans]|uniref:SCP domain-containing protein n=1 Tax=Methylobacterium radiodurans TaxID=2202828 RepID=A0A2U8VWZ2_9HYPH|nr:hypothetical protein [Methylobacterium radiodurans]AWN38317.1 hypothetical protein DK427_23355 [Methylobacterium radiodurans]